MPVVAIGGLRGPSKCCGGLRFLCEIMAKRDTERERARRREGKVVEAQRVSDWLLDGEIAAHGAMSSNKGNLTLVSQVFFKNCMHSEADNDFAIWWPWRPARGFLAVSSPPSPPFLSPPLSFFAVISWRKQRPWRPFGGHSQHLRHLHLLSSPLLTFSLSLSLFLGHLSPVL